MAQGTWTTARGTGDAAGMEAASPLDTGLDGALEAAVSGLDHASIKAAYDDQTEFVFLESFLPTSVLELLLQEYDALRSRVCRNDIPFVRRGGNIGYRALQETSPGMVALYRSPVMIELCSRLAGKQLVLKSEQDDHSCALYVYTRKGDYMTGHYDTCGCKKGASYTVILGLINRSDQHFTCELHKDDRRRPTQSLAFATEPGSAAIFCGSKLYHAVSPLNDGQERVVLSLSYADDPSMNPLVRLKENVKDAILYFGRGSAFQRNYRG